VKLSFRKKRANRPAGNFLSVRNEQTGRREAFFPKETSKPVGVSFSFLKKRANRSAWRFLSVRKFETGWDYFAMGRV
jgi:hypothetical protein